MMRGDKIVIAIDLIINYAVGKEIRSNDIYALARVGGVSGRTLERAKRLFKAEAKRNAKNESVWVVPNQGFGKTVANGGFTPFCPSNSGLVVLYSALLPLMKERNEL